MSKENNCLNAHFPPSPPTCYLTLLSIYLSVCQRCIMSWLRLIIFPNSYIWSFFKLWIWSYLSFYPTSTLRCSHPVGSKYMYDLLKVWLHNFETLIFFCPTSRRRCSHPAVESANKFLGQFLTITSLLSYKNTALQQFC